MSAEARRPRIAVVADLYLTSPPESKTRGVKLPCTVPAPVTADTPSPPRHTGLGVSVLLASALGNQADDAVTEYARNRAAHGKRIALLTITSTKRTLRLFQPIPNGRASTPQRWSLTGTEGSDSPTCGFPTDLDSFDLTGLLEQADQLLIAWLAGGSLISPALGRAAVHAIVLAGGQESQLVDAYRDLKLAASLWDHDALGVFVVGAASRGEAGRLRDRLTNLAADFLGCGIRFDGCTVCPPAGTGRLLAESASVDSDRDSTGAWFGNLYEFVSRNAVAGDVSGRSNGATNGEHDGPEDTSGSPRVVLPMRVALPLPGPLVSVAQLDTCLANHLHLWAPGAQSSERLDHGGPDGIAVRKLTRGGDQSTIVSCTLDPRLPLLETALSAAHDVPRVADVLVVGPESDRCRRAGRLLRCPLRTLHFEQIQLEGGCGLLLSPARDRFCTPDRPS